MAVLSDPRWTLNMKYSKQGTDAITSRSISGINRQGANPTGYSVSDIYDFATNYFTLANGTAVGRTLQGQYEIYSD